MIRDSEKKTIDLKFRYPDFILPAINDKSHIVTIPAGRRIGKTYNFAQWICEETLMEKCSSLWIDTVHSNIDKYIERYFIPILKPIWRYCKWNTKKKVLKFPNSGYIDFGSAQKPGNLEGFGYKRCVVNEAGHTLQKRKLWDSTIKPMIKAEDNQTRLIGTPKGKGLFEELYELGLGGKNPKYKSYRFTVYDSPFWTLEEIKEAKRSNPAAIWRQEYLASFEKFAGMIYPDFSEEIHCRPAPENDVRDLFFVALDVGWNHPTACVLAKEDTKGNLWILDEFREQFLTAPNIAKNINIMLKQNNLSRNDIQQYLIDPASRGTSQTSGESVYDQLLEENLPFTPADNDVMGGISRVTRMLRENKLFFAKGRVPKCVEEMMTYHWKEYSDGSFGMKPQPYKIGDDLVDAIRYFVMSRPDRLEHPLVDMYGRVISSDESYDFAEEEREEDNSIDEMMMDSPIDNML